MGTPSLRVLAIPSHQKVIEINDPVSGLQGYIAIHNTNLGPALGGTRIFPYLSSQQALEDSMRLSQAMTYKCAIAGLPFGGGKGVIIADPKIKNIKNILKTYAEIIESLGGDFYTGEDVGLTEEHVQYMLKFSNYFIGKSYLAGDPSPYAGLSAFTCIEAALEHTTGSHNLNSKTFAIKGVGKTGVALAELLVNAGATVYVADINAARLRYVKKLLPAVVLENVDTIDALDVDVYCPCALGNDINNRTAKQIKAHMVIGTANNQLENPRIGQFLYEKGIIHVPDYIANAGGLINVANELLPGKFSKKRVLQKINKLADTVREVLAISEKKHLSPDLVADTLAESIFYKKPASKIFNNIKQAILNVV